ncbi:MAG: 50S ribosomal protein L32 [Pseudomonadota bacterium]
MAVPKRKVSPHRRGNRRAHDSLKVTNVKDFAHDLTAYRY